jgi:hypothetical protein
MDDIVGETLATYRQQLILFAGAAKLEDVNKEEEVNKVNKCGLFFKVLSGARHNWLRHIESYIGPRRIMFAHIINTETSYYTDGPQPLIERKFIVVFLDFYQSTQTAIKGAVEVNAKKNGERNINHNNNTFYCSTISYEEAKWFYISRLNGRINYSTQLTEMDTYPDIIAAALENYIAKNDPNLVLGELPPLIYR